MSEAHRKQGEKSGYIDSAMVLVVSDGLDPGKARQGTDVRGPSNRCLAQPAAYTDRKRKDPESRKDKKLSQSWGITKCEDGVTKHGV